MSGAAVSAVRDAGQRWFDLRSYRLRWPERLAGLSAAVLLASMVLISWFTFPLRPSGGSGPKFYVPGNSVDGWNGLSHAHWLLLVTILAALGLVFFQAARPAPPIPVTFSLLVMVLGGVSTIWLIVRVGIDPPAGRDFGGWLALASAAVLTWAGYKSIRMEDIAPEDGPQEIPTVGLGGRAIASTAEEDREDESRGDESRGDESREEEDREDESPEDEASSDEDPERGEPS
jgi:hypothetical protein